MAEYNVDVSLVMSWDDYGTVPDAITDEKEIERIILEEIASRSGYDESDMEITYIKKERD